MFIKSCISASVFLLWEDNFWSQEGWRIILEGETFPFGIVNENTLPPDLFPFQCWYLNPEMVSAF